MVVDFEKEGRKLAEEARRQSAAINPHEAPNTSEDSVERMRAPEVHDGSKVVDGTTGRIAEENAPHTPTPQQPQASATADGNAVAEELPPEPERPDVPWVISNKTFEGTKESFMKKGFLKTLNGKIDEALKGNTPEDLAMSMSLAAFTLFFDMLTNYINHNRDEKDRLAKAYKDGVAAFERDMHVYQQHKDMTIWATLAEDPEFKQKFGGKALTPEMKKDAMKYIGGHPDLLQKLADAYGFLTKHECSTDEIKKQLAKTFGANSSAKDLEKLSGRGLQDPMIAESVKGAKELAAYRQKVRAYNARKERLNANRRLFSHTRNSNQHQNQQQRTQQQTR